MLIKNGSLDVILKLKKNKQCEKTLQKSSIAVIVKAFNGTFIPLICKNNKWYFKYSISFQSTWLNKLIDYLINNTHLKILDKKNSFLLRMDINNAIQQVGTNRSNGIYM